MHTTDVRCLFLGSFEILYHSFMRRATVPLSAGHCFAEVSFHDLNGRVRVIIHLYPSLTLKSTSAVDLLSVTGD
jgi:hypothetical protein